MTRRRGRFFGPNRWGPALASALFALALFIYLVNSFGEVVLFAAGQSYTLAGGSCLSERFYAPTRGLLAGTYSANGSVIVFVVAGNYNSSAWPAGFVYRLGPSPAGTLDYPLAGGRYTLLLCEVGMAPVGVGIVDPFSFRYSKI